MNDLYDLILTCRPCAPNGGTNAAWTTTFTTIRYLSDDNLWSVGILNALASHSAPAQCATYSIAWLGLVSLGCATRPLGLMEYPQVSWHNASHDIRVSLQIRVE